MQIHAARQWDAREAAVEWAQRKVDVKSGKLTKVTVEIDPFKPEIFYTKSNNCK